MATVNTVTDQYILRAQVDDTMGPALDTLQAKLNTFEKAATSGAAAATTLSGRMSDSAGRISDLATQFDKAANKYDAVTRASNQLAAAQRELQQAQDNGVRSIAAGTASQAQLDAVTSALIQKITGLATALGNARANAEAMATAQDAWNGKIGSGADAVSQYATQIANAAQVSKEAQVAFTGWMNAGQQTDQALGRFNANLQAYVASQNALRGAFDQTFQQFTTYRTGLATIQAAYATTGLSAEAFGAAVDKLKASLSDQAAFIVTVATKDEALAASKEALTAQIEAWNAATVKATESQRLWNATSGVITDAQAADNTEKSAADMRAFAAALDVIKAKYDPVFAQTLAFRDAMAALSDVVKKGGLDADTAASASVRLVDAYKNAGGVLTTVITAEEAQAQRAKEAAASIAEWTAATQAASNAQQAFNAQLGVVSDRDAASRTASRGADIEAYGAALDKLNAKIDPVFAQTLAFRQSLSFVSDALRKGAVDEATASEAMDRFAASYQAAGGAITTVLTAQEAQVQHAKEVAAAIAEWTAATRDAANAQNAFNQILGVVSDQDASAKTAGRAADIEAYGQALDDLRAKYDPVFAQTQAFRESLAGVSDALNKGAIDGATASDAMDRFTASYQAAGGAITTVMTAQEAQAQRTADSTARIAEWTAATQAAANAQQAFNTQLGVVSDQDAASRTSSRAADIEAYGEAMNREKAALVPLYAVSKDYEDELNRIDTARARGVISADEATAATNRATEAFSKANQPLSNFIAAEAQLASVTKASFAALDQHTTSMENLRASLDPVYAAQLRYKKTLEDIKTLQDETNLSDADASAMQKVAHADMEKGIETANRSGRSLGDLKFQTAGTTREFIVLGHEIVQGNYSRIPGSILVLMERAGGLKEIFQATWAAILTPTGQVVTGVLAVTAAVAALAYVGESNLRSQALMSAQLSTTRDNFTAMASAVRVSAKEIAAHTDVTHAEALVLGQSLAALPGIAGSSLTSLGIMVANLSRAMGIDLPAATKLATEAFKDPSKAALELASADKPLTSMTASLLMTIQQLDRTGQSAKATGMVLDAMGQTANTAADQTTPLRTALEALRVALMGTANDDKTFFQSIGEAIAQIAAASIDTLTALVNLIERGRKAVKADPSLRDAQVDGAVNPFGFSVAQPLGGGINDINAQVVNPSGARGFMQVMPDSTQGVQGGSTTARTIAGKSFDLNDAAQNIEAGIQVLLSDLKAANGNVDAALKSYGGFKYKDATAYIASVKAADVTTLPPDVVQLIATVGNKMGAAKDVIDLAQHLAVPESASTIQRIVSDNRRTGSSGDTLPTPPIPPEVVPPEAFGPQRTAEDARYVAEQEKLAKAGIEVVKANNAQAVSIEDLRKQMLQLEANRQDLLSHPTGQSDVDALNLERNAKAQEELTVKIKDARDPTREATLTLLDQAKAAGVLGAADQALLAVHNQFAHDRAQNPSNLNSEAAETAKLAATQANLTAEFQHALAVNTLTIKQSGDITAGYQKGTAAGLEAQVQVEAFNQTLAKFSKDSPDFNKRVQQAADSIRAVRDAATGTDLSKMTAATNDQADATLRIAGAWDGSAASLSHLTDLETARSFALSHGYKEGQAGYTEAVNGYVASLDKAAAATRIMQQEQNSVSAVEGAATQAFTTVGNAISQAFVQGQGAAVNWGNVMKSVLSQVIQKIAELAVLNPVLNSLFGSNLGTLQTAVNVFGQSGGVTSSGGGGGVAGGGGGGGSLIGTLSNGMSLYSGGSTLLGATGIGTVGAAGAAGASGLVLNAGTGLYSAGATAGGGGLLSSLGLGGVGSSITGVLNTPLATGIGVNAGAGSFGAVTLGQALGGVGLGFTAGSLAGGLVQKGLDKTGPAPTIGAAGGAIAGAAIGSVIPGIGTVIGGLIGGLVGGAGGGLIGPHPASTYSSIGLNAQGGQIVEGSLVQQGEPDRALAQFQALTSAIQNLDVILNASGVSVSGQVKAVQIGDNSNRSGPDPTKYLDLATPNFTGGTAFQAFRFNAADPTLNDRLNGKQFDTPDQLATWLAAFQQTQAAVKAYLTDTAATLKALGATTGSLPDSIKSVTDAYTVDKVAMDGLIASGYLTAQQTDDMTKAEADLASIRDKSIQAAIDATNAHYQQMDAGFTSRQLSATASISGTSADQQAYTLFNFDAGATQQRAQLKADMVSIFGDTVTTTENYTNQMAQLETTLGRERLAIVTQYANQIKAAIDAIGALDTTETGRMLTARATTGNTGIEGTRGVALFNFDTSATTERAALIKTLTATFGAAYLATKGYSDQVLLLDNTLDAERLALNKQYNDQIIAAQQAMTDTATALTVRMMNAQVTLGVAGADATKAALLTFDASAAQQRTALSKQMTDAFGDAYKTTTDYAAQMNQLEVTLGQERLVVAQQANTALIASNKSATEQATASAATFIASLNSWVTTLSQGPMSPLSPAAQLASTQDTFSTTSAKAQAGDAKAMSSLQDAGNALLTAGKAYYGSSVGYTALYQQVIEAIKGVSQLSPDTLTASFLAEQTQTQTTTLAANLQQLRDSVAALQSATTSGTSASDQDAIASATSNARMIAGAIDVLRQETLTDAGIPAAHIDALSLQVQAAALVDATASSAVLAGAHADALTLKGQIDTLVADTVSTATRDAAHADAEGLRTTIQGLMAAVTTGQSVTTADQALMTAANANAQTISTAIDALVNETLTAAGIPAAHIDALALQQKVEALVASTASSSILSGAHADALMLRAQVDDLVTATESPTTQAAAHADSVGLQTQVVSLLNTTSLVGGSVVLANQAQLVGAHTDALSILGAINANGSRLDWNTTSTVSHMQIYGDALVAAVNSQGLAVTGQIVAANSNIAAGSSAAHTDIAYWMNAVNGTVGAWGANLFAQLGTVISWLSISATNDWTIGGQTTNAVNAMSYQVVTWEMAINATLAGIRQNQGSYVSVPISSGGLSGEGSSGALAAGGWVGNGVWNKDTVRAAFAGGGDIMLAGGEYVVSAPAAALYSDVLPKINAGSYSKTTSGGGDGALLAELRALRTQNGTTTVMETRSQTATLVAEIRALRAEVAGLRQDTKKTTATPERLVA